MGFLPSPNNCIVWNRSKSRYEAWAMHTQRGLAMISYDPGRVDGTVDQGWLSALWKHMLDQTEGLTTEHLKRGALFEFVNQDKQGAP